MAEHVCPWWVGYILALPLRRIWQNPQKILSSHVREGMTVLEPGPGMGFFTLDLAKLVGAEGRVFAVDVQPKMLKSLMRRARKAGLADRIVPLQVKSETMGIGHLAGQVDFILAFAMVHETPDAAKFFQEASAAMKTGGKMLLAEPSGHVKSEAWKQTLKNAADAGLHEEKPLTIKDSHAMLLVKA